MIGGFLRIKGLKGKSGAKNNMCFKSKTKIKLYITSESFVVGTRERYRVLYFYVMQLQALCVFHSILTLAVQFLKCF